MFKINNIYINKKISNLELIEKEQNKKKNNLIKPILINKSIISIALLFYLYLTNNNKNNIKNQKHKIFADITIY